MDEIRKAAGKAASSNPVVTSIAVGQVGGQLSEIFLWIISDPQFSVALEIPVGIRGAITGVVVTAVGLTIRWLSKKTSQT